MGEWRGVRFRKELVIHLGLVIIFLSDYVVFSILLALPQDHFNEKPVSPKICHLGEKVFTFG